MAKQNFGGVYANMDFPAWQFVEYPKHIITGLHGKFETAYSAADEERIRARLQKDQDDAPAEHVPYVADPAKEILISRARELGVAFNSKWSKAKLEQTVKAAEDAVDDLPAEEVAVRPKRPMPTPPIIENDEEATADVQKARLYDRAKELGLNAQGMHLWGIPRLKAAIAEAQLHSGE